MMILSVLSVLIALLVLGYAVWSQRSAKKALNTLRDQLDDTRDSLRMLQKKVTATERDLAELREATASRLEKLERPFRSTPQPRQATAPQQAKPAPQAKPRDGYFGSPKGDASMALFNDEYQELRDECFFRVHYDSPAKAHFQPIDLMRLKSLPAIEGIVRYEGCPLKEARGFQLLREGIVEKQNNYWVITAPVELQMQK